MPRIIYPAVFRGLAGKPANPVDVVENLDAIQGTANRLDWENFDDGSLLEEHIRDVAPGQEPPSKIVAHAAIRGTAPPTYAKAYSGTWRTFLTVQAGPFEYVDSGGINQGQSLVFVIASLGTSPRHQSGAYPWQAAGNPDQSHQIAVRVNGSMSPPFELGCDASDYHGGMIHAFKPTKNWMLVELMFKAEWMAGASPPTIGGDLEIRAGSLTVIGVVK